MRSDLHTILYIYLFNSLFYRSRIHCKYSSYDTNYMHQKIRYSFKIIMSNIGIMINGTRILNREKKRLMNTPMGKEHHALTVKMKEGKRLLKQYMNVSKLVQSAASDYEISSTRPSDTSINKPFLRMPTKGTDIILDNFFQ